MQESKLFSKEAFQIAEKRREVKGKRDRERYTQPNAEFQRIPRRYKKGFLSEQDKEIEENKRMGKSRDLFKKISPGYPKCHLEIAREHFIQNGYNKGQKWYGPNRSRRD